MPIQLAGNVKHGGLFETAFGITLGELVDDIGGGTRAAARCARSRSAGRSAPISRARCSTRPFDYEAFAARDGLIGHGGIVVFDDTRRHGEAGALRHGILRDRILRQVHALPDRLDPRRRGHRPHRPRRGPRRQPRGARRPLRHHEVRLALRARRLHALSGDERAHAFPGRFRRQRRTCRPPNKENAMSLIHEIDYGTPRSKAEKTVTLTIDGQR